MSRLSAENTTSAGIFEAWRMGIFEVIIGEMVRELFRLQGAVFLVGFLGEKKKSTYFGLK